MYRSLVVVLAAGLAGGCGGRNVVPVSGQVTLDGRPVAGVHVGFQPMATGGEKNPGGGSYAITDADGRFALKLVEGDGTGAVVGKHRVEIATRITDDPANDARPKTNPKAMIPAKYNKNSDLTYDVPSGGTDKANFELKSQ